MKIIIILLLSIGSIYLGVSGYIYVNRPKAPETKKRFDPKLESDKLSFASSSSVTSARIASIKRMGIKKDRKFRAWALKDLESVDPAIRSTAIEEIGYFNDEEVNQFLYSKINTKDRISVLKAFAKIESEARAIELEKLDTTKFSKLELIYFYIASFKSNVYFSKKKVFLIKLVEMAEEAEDSKELDLIVNSLAIHVPNFKRFHELLKVLLYKSKSNSVIERAVKHLAVYEKGWLKLQMKKVVESKNSSLIKAYLDRAGVVCPLGYWESLSKIYEDDKTLALDSAFSLNTKKATSFLKSKESTNSKVFKKYEAKFGEKLNLCY